MGERFGIWSQNGPDGWGVCVVEVGEVVLVVAERDGKVVAELLKGVVNEDVEGSPVVAIESVARLGSVDEGEVSLEKSVSDAVLVSLVPVVGAIVTLITDVISTVVGAFVI